MEGSIAVLGRGDSLRRYRKYSHLFDKIYIAGRFRKEVRKLGIKHLKGKKIIHVVARGELPFERLQYKSLNILYSQTQFHSFDQYVSSKGRDCRRLFPSSMKFKLLPENMRNRGYPVLWPEVIVKHKDEFKDYKKLCRFLEETYKEKIMYRQARHKRIRLWPTLGIFALDLALCVEKPKKIFMFGIDFFDKLTYCKYGEADYANTNTKVHKNGMVDLMKYHVEQLIEEFPDIKFYTSSKVLKLKKLKLLRKK